MTTLRSACADDLPAVIDIYNYEVEHGVATFDTVPWTLEDRAPWFAAHASPQHPLIVVVESGRVVGWGSLSAWSDRCAYARAAEVSVYVHQDHRGHGIGRALLAELIVRGRAASLALHRALGFQPIGTMRRVGEKSGRLLDVELLDLHLDTPDAR